MKPLKIRPFSCIPQAVNFFIFYCCAVLSSQCLAATPPISELTLAYAPVLSRQLIESRSQPLIDYFKKRHQVNIQLHHSTDFNSYLNSALNNQFDVTISPINYAQAFNSQLSFQPLVKSKRQFNVLILKRKADSSINSIQQLLNRSVGVPGELSFISSLFSDTLSQQGIDTNTQLKVIRFDRHDLLFLSLLRAEIDAAITVEITLEMASHIKENLTVIDKIPAGPAVFSASTRLNAKQQQWLSQALLEFSQTAEGKHYLLSLSFDQLEAIDEQQFSQFQRYSTALHNKLNKAASPAKTII